MLTISIIGKSYSTMFHSPPSFQEWVWKFNFNSPRLKAENTYIWKKNPDIIIFNNKQKEFSSNFLAKEICRMWGLRKYGLFNKK